MQRQLPLNLSHNQTNSLGSCPIPREGPYARVSNHLNTILHAEHYQTCQHKHLSRKKCSLRKHQNTCDRTVYHIEVQHPNATSGDNMFTEMLQTTSVTVDALQSSVRKWNRSLWKFFWMQLIWMPCNRWAITRSHCWHHTPLPNRFHTLSHIQQQHKDPWMA